MSTRISLSSRMIHAYCDECGNLEDQISLYSAAGTMVRFERMYKTARCWRCGDRSREKKLRKNENNR